VVVVVALSVRHVYVSHYAYLVAQGSRHFGYISLI